MVVPHGGLVNHNVGGGAAVRPRRPATGSCSSPRSASTSPSRRSSPPGLGAARRPARRDELLDPRRVRRVGRASGRSPSSTCRRPTGTPGSTAWPTRGGGCRGRSGSWWSAARRPGLGVRGLARLVGGDRVRWINTYGPTEATVDRDGLRAAPDRPGRELPIGRPIANARAYVLDARLQSGAGRACRASCIIGGDGRGPRLPRPARPDRRAVRARPLRRRAGRPAVPDRRPGPLACRRPARVPRPRRRPGQGPRLPGRAGRGRGGPRGRSPRSARPPWSPARGRQVATERWSPTSSAGAAQSCGQDLRPGGPGSTPSPPRPGFLRRPRCPAAHTGRKGRSRRPAAARRP